MASGNGNGWKLTKEKILLFLGVGTFLFELVNSEVLDRPYHREYILAALALCGVAFTQWLDKK